MASIKVADNIGFCPGVRRAVELALEVRKEAGCDVYTFGELIHNSEVIEGLEAQGVHSVLDLGLLKTNDTVLIRSHGVTPEVYEECKRNGLNVVDATCAFVKRIHGIVLRYAAKNYPVIVVGNSTHPETLGILGYCGLERFVVESKEDCLSLPELKKALIVSQTTFDSKLFDELAQIMSERIDETIIYKTICDTTRKRQTEAMSLSKTCDAMIVIGGKNSSNTHKLLKICKENCEKSICIENVSDVLLDKLKNCDIIGVVAGASTPDRMIREVITRMNELVTTAKNEEQEITDAVTQTAAPVAANEPEPTEGSPVENVAEAKVSAESDASDDSFDVIDEATDKMPVSAADIGDQTFEEALEKTLVRLRGGQVLSGRVVQITDDELCVNVGYKSDGIIPLSEFSDDPNVKPSDLYKPGDKIKVEVLKVNDGEGNVLLSRKNVENREKMSAMLKDADVKEKIFDATGKMAIRGGLLADVNGMEVFIPASLLATRYVENIKDYVGKPLKVKIIEIDKRRKHIVASAKAAIIELENIKKRELREQLEVGAKVKGVIKSLTDFGAFVDIGGIEGLLHITDISWGRLGKPSDVFKSGQTIEVLILNVDLQKDRVSLGYKQLQPKPWTLAAEKYPVGSIVTGKVVRLTTFGAFVELEPTIDGLIHISEVAERRIDKVEDVLKLGDMVRCKVLDVNPQAKRMSLSRKAVIFDENPELVEQLEREREERERERNERIAKQRAAEQARAERTVAKNEQQVRSGSDRPQREQRRTERPERGERDRRPRREDSDYRLPPVEQATTSLAGLFSDLGIFGEPVEPAQPTADTSADTPQTENVETVENIETQETTQE